MAFMVPIVQKDWDIYGTGRSRRSSQQQTPGSSSGRCSRSQSQASSNFSRPASFGSAVPEHKSAPASVRRHSSGQRSVTFGPPSPPAHAHRSPAPSSSSSSKAAGFHAKVVDKLMKVIRKDDSRQT